MNRRGIALVVALYALLVMGALAAAAFFVALQEQRAGERQRWVHRALGAAEAGAYEALRGVSAVALGARLSYPRDPPLPVEPRSTPFGTGFYHGRIIKLNSHLYFVDVTAQPAWPAQPPPGPSRDTVPGARARVGLLTRLRPLAFDALGAIVTGGPVELTRDSTVSAAPHNPPGWRDCDTTQDPPRDAVHFVDGPSVLDAVFGAGGDSIYARLASLATARLHAGSYRTQPSAAGSGACDSADPRNWGDGLDPNGVCGRYRPIIHVAGDLVLTGGQGQGMLLVDGDLQIQGSYQFFGLIVVKGAIQMVGAAEIWGAVIAGGSDRETHRLAAGVAVRYSKCAIAKALSVAGTLEPIASRAWLQLF